MRRLARLKGHITFRKSGYWNVDPNRRPYCLPPIATFTRSIVSAPESIGLKAPTGHTTDDGDRLGECHYAKLLLGWAMDVLGRHIQENGRGGLGGTGWIAQTRCGC